MWLDWPGACQGLSDALGLRRLGSISPAQLVIGPPRREPGLPSEVSKDMAMLPSRARDRRLAHERTCNRSKRELLPEILAWALALGGCSAVELLAHPGRPGAARWSVDPRYSHGFLVPLFSLFLLWFRRGMCPSGLAPAAACWWGVALIAVGMVLRFGGVYAYMEWLESAALLPFLAGIAVLMLGWPGLRWSFPSIAFLLFMIPLPFRLEVALETPCSGWPPGPAPTSCKFWVSRHLPRRT